MPDDSHSHSAQHSAQAHSADGAPKGTFALMLVTGLLMAAGWAAMFFYQFLAHGPVN